MINIDDISIGVKVDLTEAERQMTEFPKDVKKQWEEVNRVMSGGTLGGAAGQRVLRAYQGVRDVLGNVGEQGFFTIPQRRDFDRSMTEINRIYKRFFSEQTKIAKEALPELREAEKQYEEIFKRYQKLMPDEKATPAGQRLREEMLARGRAFDALHERVHGPERQQSALQEALTNMQDTAALLPTLQEERQEKKRRGEFLGGIPWQFARGMLGVGVIGGLGFYAAAKVRREFSGELERGIAEADLAQRIRPGGMAYEDYRNTINRLNPSFTPDENVSFLQQYSALAGAEGAFQRGAEATGLTRAFGFAPAEGAQFFGRAGQLGLTGGEEGQRKFAQLLADAIAEGRMKGREGEVWESVLSLSQAVTSRTGDATDATNIAGLLARLSATGLPGLRGEMGAGVVGRVDAAISSTQLLPRPGGIREAAALTAFPGMDLVGIQEQLEKGVGGPGFAKILQSARQLFGGSREGDAFVAQEFGIPLNVRDKFFAAASRNAGPQELQGILGEQGDRTEADIRRQLAELKQLEADAVRPLIPLYADLLKGVTAILQRMPDVGRAADLLIERAQALTGDFKTMHGFLEGLFQKFSWLLPSSMQPIPQETLSNLWPANAKPGEYPFTSDLTSWGDVLQGQGARGLDPTGLLKRQGLAVPSADMRALITQAAGREGVDPLKMLALAGVESSYNPSARNYGSGAYGLYQFMPATAERYGVNYGALGDPKIAATLASKEFGRLLKKYGGSEEHAWAAYNWGEGHVETGEPLDVLRTMEPRETREGFQRYQRYKQALSGGAVPSVVTQASDALGHAQAAMARAEAAAARAETSGIAWQSGQDMRLTGQLQIHVNVQHPDGSVTTHVQRADAAGLNLDWRTAQKNMTASPLVK